MSHIPEEEKVCKETGVALQKIGEEISHKLVFRQGSYFLKRIIRPKYAHPIQEEKGIITASMPDSILPKCRADEILLAEIITRKFVDHLPLYRIAEAFSRDGIIISRRLLSQWVVAVGEALKPLYKAMKEKILQSDRLHIDESPVDIFESPKVRQGYMWVHVGGVGADPPCRLYSFYENRKHEHADKLLDSYQASFTLINTEPMKHTSVKTATSGARSLIASRKTSSFDMMFVHVQSGL